jgi:hypothetical protein
VDRGLVVLGAGGTEKRMEALLDSGSEVNILSRGAAEAFRGDSDGKWVKVKSGVVCRVVSETGRSKRKGVHGGARCWTGTERRSRFTWGRSRDDRMEQTGSAELEGPHHANSG